MNSETTTYLTTTARYRWLARQASVRGELMAEGEFDLLHGHFAAPAGEWVALVGAMTGIPFSFTAHRRDIFDNLPAAFEAIAKMATVVVTVSEYNRHYIIRHFGVSPNKIAVIPCGVDTTLFYPAMADVKGSGQVARLVTVARLAPEKGLECLLEYYAILHREGILFDATIIGDGAQREELNARCAKLGLDERMWFAGPQSASEVRTLLQESDGFILARLSEGLPVAYMDAMACGLPVVGTDIVGVAELAKNGVHGILMPPSDPEALASALRKLIAERGSEMVRHIGEASRCHVVEHFSLTTQVQRLISEWQKVV